MSLHKSTYVFYNILEMLEDKDKIRMQLISKKFYERIVPYALSSVKVAKCSHVRPQTHLYQYASGFIMSRNVSDVVEESAKGA
jgi:hypothetical protein